MKTEDRAESAGTSGVKSPAASVGSPGQIGGGVQGGYLPLTNVFTAPTGLQNLTFADDPEDQRKMAPPRPPTTCASTDKLLKADETGLDHYVTSPPCYDELFHAGSTYDEVPNGVPRAMFHGGSGSEAEDTATSGNESEAEPTTSAPSVQASPYTADVISPYTADVNFPYTTDITSAYNADVIPPYTADVTFQYTADVTYAYTADVTSPYTADVTDVKTSCL